MGEIKRERIRERIKAQCARVIMEELRDPRGGFVTVQNVELSDDLRNAKVFVSILGEEPERRRVMRMLEDARGFIQRAVVSTLRTRVTPTLRFVLDTSIDKAFKVAAILEEIKKEKPSPLEISDDLGDPSAQQEDDEEDGEEDDADDEGEGDEEDAPPAPLPKKKKEGGRGLRGKKKMKARREDEEDLVDDGEE